MNLSAICIFVAFTLQNADIPSKYLTPAPAKDKVLAKVDGVEIKAGDVESLLWEWRGQEVVADLVSYQMMKNAASKAKVSVADKEVDDALEQQLAAITPQMTGGKPRDQYLLDQGFTKSRLWMRLKTELLLNKIAALDFKPDEYIKISTIIVKAESTSTASATAAAKKADLFYDKLIKGASWESVLQLSTTDVRTLDANGLVGWRKIEAFPEEVRLEMAKSKAGGYTKPALTANGFQIFRIEMYGRDAKGKDLQDAIDIHVASVRASVLQKIRSESKVERITQN